MRLHFCSSMVFLKLLVKICDRCSLCMQFWLIQWAIPGLGMFCEVGFLFA